VFEFNALSQFSIALFIYHGGRPCDVCQGQSIQGQHYKFIAKAGQSQGQEIWPRGQGRGLISIPVVTG